MSDSEDSDNSFTNKKNAGFKRGREENSLNDSLRKKPLQTTYVTVEEEDGSIRHLPVSVQDDEFTNKQPILNSLAILGDINVPQGAAFQGSPR